MIGRHPEWQLAVALHSSGHRHCLIAGGCPLIFPQKISGHNPKIICPAERTSMRKKKKREREREREWPPMASPLPEGYLLAGCFLGCLAKSHESCNAQACTQAPESNWAWHMDTSFRDICYILIWEKRIPKQSLGAHLLIPTNSPWWRHKTCNRKTLIKTSGYTLKFYRPKPSVSGYEDTSINWCASWLWVKRWVAHCEQSCHEASGKNGGQFNRNGNFSSFLLLFLTLPFSGHKKCEGPFLEPLWATVETWQCNKADSYRGWPASSGYIKG